MSTSWADAIRGEQFAIEKFRTHARELARAAATHTLWTWGDGDGGALRSILDDSFSEHGLDLFGWHKAKPERVPLTDAERQAIFERDGRRCRWCGETTALTIDHIRPVRWGGTNDSGNLQVLCAACNAWKSDRRPS